MWLSAAFLYAEEHKKSQVVIGGTGSAIGSIKELAGAFEKINPDVIIKVLPSIGSGGGIKAAIECIIDIGISSRPLTGDELKQGAEAEEYAWTPFVFVTSHKIDGFDFDIRKIAAIYAGEIIKWPGGIPIRLVLRPESDSDILTLRGISPGMDKAVRKAMLQEGMIIAPTDQESARDVEQISGSLGTSTLSLVLSEKRRVNVLPLNGVAPGVKTLADGTYPYYKRQFLVTGPRAAPAAKKFIEFVKSVEGHAILAGTGHLPVSGKK